MDDVDVIHTSLSKLYGETKKKKSLALANNAQNKQIMKQTLTAM